MAYITQSNTKNFSGFNFSAIALGFKKFGIAIMNSQAARAERIVVKYENK